LSLLVVIKYLAIAIHHERKSANKLHNRAEMGLHLDIVAKNRDVK